MPAWPRPEPPAPRSGREHAAALQALHVVVGGIIVFLLGAGALAATTVARNRDRGSVDGRTAAVSAGPARGTPLSPYITQRVAALSTARGRPTAIVSFRAYVRESDVGKLLRGVRVRRWLVAAPSGEPKDTADVPRWREGTIRVVTSEIADFEQILPTLTQDPEFEAQTRRDLDADRRILAGLRAGVPTVFAVVVDGPAADVRALARVPEVRLVDLAPAAIADGGTAIGVRPEESVVAGDPTTRPA